MKHHVSIKSNNIIRTFEVESEAARQVEDYCAEYGECVLIEETGITKGIRYKKKARHATQTEQESCSS